MDNLASKLAALARRHAALALVALTGICVTFAAWAYTSRMTERQAAARFDALVSDAVSAVQVRMEAYLAALRATRGIFLDGREPGRRPFREFVASLEISRHYPGIQGIGYAKLLRPEEVASHEDAVREEGFPAYRVWPAHPRELYTAIVYLEPFDWRNQRAFGFDMFAEPVRREAMERARDTGDAAASGRVELVQEAGRERQAGFLVYLPVYSQRATTAEERREHTAGWVYAPFRSGDFLRETVDAETARVVDIQVYDGPETAPEMLLFGSGAQAASPLRELARIEVAGRTWTLQFTARTAFLTLWERWLPPFVIFAGLFLTGLLFWITRREVRALDEAQRARARAAFLAEAGKILGSSLDYPRNVERVAALTTERVADGCIVYVDEPIGAPLNVVSHRDRAVAQDARDALPSAWADPAARTGPGAALRTGRPEVLNDLKPDGKDPRSQPFLANRPRLLELHRRARTRHALTIPLLARGEPLGTITLTSRRRRFGPAEVALGEDLGRLVVAAIDAGRLYRRAQESLRIRDEFLSIASHEFRTPLTSLVLLSESLRASAPSASAEVVVRKADGIRRNVDRLSRLVATLLDLTRITAGRLEIHREDVDLVEVVHDVAGRLEDEARRAGCELRLDAPGPVVGRWDRLRLDQVVTNLVTNAVKYGPGKPVDVRVEKRLDRARLTIRDHGIGIASADQKRIFERFERAVSERNYGGFGLGLWIVRRIVEAMGGTIHVESAPGQGATFVVELHRAVDEVAADEVGEQTPPPEAAPARRA